MSSSSKDNNPSQDDNNKDSNNKDNDNNKKRPLTAEGVRPQKKFYRQRAHCNPLSHNDAFEYPVNPSAMDWTKEFFPGMPVGTTPTVLDVGCGFGGTCVRDVLWRKRQLFGWSWTLEYALLTLYSLFFRIDLGAGKDSTRQGDYGDGNTSQGK